MGQFIALALLIGVIIGLPALQLLAFRWGGWWLFSAVVAAEIGLFVALAASAMATGSELVGSAHPMDSYMGLLAGYIAWLSTWLATEAGIAALIIGFRKLQLNPSPARPE